MAVQPRPLGVPGVAVVPCCERDTNGDGDCDRHKRCPVCGDLTVRVLVCCLDCDPKRVRGSR